MHNKCGREKKVEGMACKLNKGSPRPSTQHRIPVAPIFFKFLREIYKSQDTVTDLSVSASWLAITVKVKPEFSCSNKIAEAF